MANPGDTTWVQAQNDVQLDWYNNFDAPVTFPSGSVSYRKIIMVFTLGKYQCPSGSQYCGDWDYTVQNFLMTPTDTFELSRLITPYANASFPRTGWNWKQRYYFDVTDFYPVLKNNAAIRLLYQGYSGGFTANIKFAFIEGTPPRTVTGIKRLWHGQLPFGNPSDVIENYLPAINTIAPAGTQQCDLKFTVTGHGSDGTNCAEFCSKYYQVYANSNLVEQKTIWKTDCGSNNLYPQSGTWIYSRAGWCPGEQVLPNVHKMGAITAGNSLTADVNFQNYSNTGAASYIVEGNLFFYGAYSQQVDASVENIIAPNDYEGVFRSNPICGNPIITVKNTGATTINSLSFQYGVVGQTLQTYTSSSWSLAPSKDTTIMLPDLSALTSLTANTVNKFTVSILHVNGGADGYALNNTMQTSFVTAPDYPGQFNVVLKTNASGTQTKWRVEDLAGTIYQFRNPTTSNTLYTDTVSLPDGCYRLVVTDAGCDGLYFFSSSKGYVYAAKKDGTHLPMSNGLPTTTSNAEIGDFGCGFTQYFRVSNTLPASQLLLKGEAKDTANLLSWQTATETNTDHFNLEFSVNDTTFSTVAAIPAKGNATTTSSYSTSHKPAVQASFNYYRLKLYYTDGTWKYSNTVMLTPPSVPVTGPGSDFVVTMNPNPFTSQLKVTFKAPAAQAVAVTVYDLRGRLLLSRSMTVQAGVTTMNLDETTMLSAGLYTVVVTSNGQKTVKKIIKQ
jgi:hypothetical protein